MGPGSLGGSSPRGSSRGASLGNSPDMPAATPPDSLPSGLALPSRLAYGAGAPPQAEERISSASAEERLSLERGIGLSYQAPAPNPNPNPNPYPYPYPYP